MSLTGPVLFWLLAALTVAGFAGAVLTWPALAGPHPGRVAGRVGVLVVVNALVLLSAAVRLNDQFLFFAGWADLRGAVTGADAAAQLRGGGTATAAASAHPAGAVAAVPVALLPLPAGSRVADGVVAYRVTGPLSGVTGQVLVRVPPGYQAAAHRRYPVLETFSGYPGSVSQWVKTMRLPATLDAQAAAGRIGAAIVVSPQIELPAGVDTECVDGRTGEPRIETWVARDVPDWVAAHFRVAADRASWATVGLSAGGWCAAMVAMLHPAQFGAAIVLGGYFHPVFEPAYEPFTLTSAAGRRYDLVALAKRTPPPLALWVETSHADPVSYRTTAALLATAHRPLSATATVLHDAGHRIGVWQALLPSALTWLGTALPGFRAT